MISPELCALLAGFFLAVTSLGSARVVRAGVDPWILMVLVYLSSSLLVGAALKPVGILTLGGWEWCLLITNGLLWIYGDYAGTRATQWIDPSLSKIFGGLSQVIVFFAGVLCFAEPINLPRGFGVLLMATAFVLGNWNIEANGPGLRLLILSTIVVAVARVYDTYLARLLTPELITFTGYVVPCSLLIALRPRTILLIPSTLRTGGKWGIMTMISSPLCYYFMMQALAHGELTTTTVLLQTNMVFLLLLERLVLRTEPPSINRILSCLLCACAAVLLVVR